MNRVLIGPAPLREIEPSFAPVLRAAGLELVYPAKKAQMTEAELLAQLPGCVASLAGSEPYTPAVLAAGAKAGLKCVCRAGVGYDGVNVPAATEQGIAVGYAPGTNQDAVAEHAILHMLALVKNLIRQDAMTRNGEWPRRMVGSLRGKTVGIIGLGRTGKAVATRLKVFGVTMLACDPYAGAEFAAANGIPLTTADDIFRLADIVTLHTPLTDETRKLVNARTLGLMKPTAFVVNTSRGPVVDEAALLEALTTNRIAGAGLDVYEDEPPPLDHPLFKLPNVTLTAHVAGIDGGSLRAMAQMAAETIVHLLAGRWPEEQVVNPAVRDRMGRG